MYKRVLVICSLLWVVFMSPESAVNPPWRALFTADYVKRNLALVAIDEAHCIVDWSVIRVGPYVPHDYLFVGDMLLEKPSLR